MKLVFISSISLFNYSSIAPSVIDFPSIKRNIDFFRSDLRNCCISFSIFNCFSLSILFKVFESLQYTLGIIGVPRYSPIKASICFFISGVNSIEVGLPIPKFSSRYLNYSSSRTPL